MRARFTNMRTWVLGATVGALLLVGASVAYATGSGDDSSENSTGPGIEKAKSVALDHVDGRVTDTEVGDEEGYYEIEVSRDDGGQVDVHLDKNFDVLGTLDDNESVDDEDAAEDRGE